MKLSDVLVPSENGKFMIKDTKPKFTLSYLCYNKKEDKKEEEKSLLFEHLENIVDPKYLYYYVVYNFKLTNLTVDEILNLDINLPSLDTQTKRVNMLSFVLDNLEKYKSIKDEIRKASISYINKVRNEATTNIKLSDLCIIPNMRNLIMLFKLCKGHKIGKYMQVINDIIKFEYLRNYLYLVICDLKEEINGDTIIPIVDNQDSFIEETDQNVMYGYDYLEGYMLYDYYLDNGKNVIRFILNPV